jgi:hypothetical protein
VFDVVMLMVMVIVPIVTVVVVVVVMFMVMVMVMALPNCASLPSFSFSARHLFLPASSVWLLVFIWVFT